MTTFRKTPVKSEISGDEPLSDYALGYLNQRVRNSFYHYVLRRFHDAAERENLTKTKLAKRLGITPSRVTRLLASPSNWTLDTVSELLVGICREELKPHSDSYLGRPERNYQSEDLREALVHTQQVTRQRHDKGMIWANIPISGANLEICSNTEPQRRTARLPSIAG